MKWPWISRVAYDYVVEQNRLMLEELVRLRRREAGMTETPVAPLPPVPQMTEIPLGVEEIIAGFDSGMVRQSLRDQARQLYARGNDWNAVADHLRAVLGDDAEDLGT